MGKAAGQLCGVRSGEQVQWRRWLDCVRLVALCCCTCLGVPSAAGSQPKTMYLNSPYDCGHGDTKALWHTVRPESLFVIQDDMSPHTRTKPFVNNCDMVFRSLNIDGHLCVFQRKLAFIDNKVELRLFDKDVTEPDTKADKVVNDEKFLEKVEWCTTGNILTLEMGKRMNGASVENVDIDLLVYHISSIHRKGYMDTTPFCGSRYVMDHSRVKVTNRDLAKTGPVHPRCTLDFHYSGKEVRNICIIFSPLTTATASAGASGANRGGGGDSAGCRNQFNYTLHVYEEGNAEPVLSLGGCGNLAQRRWCSNSTTNSTQIRLKLERHSGFEDVALFNAVIMDHIGGASTLPLLPAESDEALTSDPSLLLAILLTSLCLVIIVTAIIAVVLWRRRQTQKPPAKSNGEATHHMLGGQKCPSQENHYTTDQTPCHV